MSIFSRSLEREEWGVAALCLMLGTLEAASKLPQGALARLRRAEKIKTHSGRRRGGARG